VFSISNDIFGNFRLNRLLAALTLLISLTALRGLEFPCILSPIWVSKRKSWLKPPAMFTEFRAKEHYLCEARHFPSD
jgi:hypothetical protein